MSESLKEAVISAGIHLASVSALLRYRGALPLDGSPDGFQLQNVENWLSTHAGIRIQDARGAPNHAELPADAPLLSPLEADVAYLRALADALSHPVKAEALPDIAKDLFSLADRLEQRLLPNQAIAGTEIETVYLASYSGGGDQLHGRWGALTLRFVDEVTGEERHRRYVEVPIGEEVVRGPASDNAKPSPGFQRYRSHKVVEAAEIVTFTTESVCVGDGLDRRWVNVPKDFFARGTPDKNDFLVCYNASTPKEYLSWSPRDLFLDGYTRISDE